MVVALVAVGGAGCSTALPVGRGATTTAPIRATGAAGTAPTTTTGAPQTTTTTPTTTTTTAAAPPAVTTTTAAAGTAQVDYQPFSGSVLAAGVTATGTDSGHCLTYGGGSGSRVYYRCFGTTVVDGHTTVYDPCFAGAAGTSSPLACPESTSPSFDDVVMFTVSSLDTGEPPSAVSYPWAMQLASGQLCLFVSGAWGGLGPYSCQTFTGSGAVADCHQPASGNPWWSAACQVDETSQSPFTGEQVGKVWF